VLKGHGRGPGFIARVKSEVLCTMDAGVNAKGTTSDKRGAIRSECKITGMRDSGKRIRCYAWGKFGHVSRACTMEDGSGLRNNSENERQHPAGPRQ